MEDSEEEVVTFSDDKTFDDGDDMDIDMPRANEITECILARNLLRNAECLYGQLANDGWERHEEASASYYDLRANVEKFHDEVVDARDKSDVVVTSSSSSAPLGSTPILTDAPSEFHAPIGGEVYIKSQATGPSFITPKPTDKGKGIAKLFDDSLPKLVKALRKVYPYLYVLVLIDYELPSGKMVKMAYAEVKEVEVIIYGGKDFVKHQEELLSVHNEKVKRNAKKEEENLGSMKRKTIELEPEEYISCPEGVKFFKNKVIEEPEFVIMEYLVKISKKARILELKRRHLKITVLTTNTPYPSRKIPRIVARPKIEDKDNFELKGQFLKELRTNTFSASNHEDVNEHIKKVLKIVDLFHIPNITIDQVMLRAFPMSLTGAASRWLRNKPSGSITTYEDLKTKFLSKYCTHARTAKKMEEINNFQQEPEENLYQAWERFKELLMKCFQHYLTEMQEVDLFYNGLDVPTRQILDSRGAIPSKTAADAKEEGKTLKEAYYTQFGAPFQEGGYRATALGFYQRNNAKPSYQEQRQSMEETLSKFMGELAKRHEENSNLIK
ncbi:hypothetical protein Tco_0832707 [Tanacetum coccineum]